MPQHVLLRVSLRETFGKPYKSAAVADATVFVYKFFICYTLTRESLKVMITFFDSLFMCVCTNVYILH